MGAIDLLFIKIMNENDKLRKAVFWIGRRNDARFTLFRLRFERAKDEGIYVIICRCCFRRDQITHLRL